MLWYSYLRQQVQLEVDKSVNLAHHAVNPSWEVSPTPACGFTAPKASSRTSDCAGEEESTPRAQRSQGTPSTPSQTRLRPASPSVASADLDTTPRASVQNARRKRAREAEPPVELPTPENPFPEPRERAVCSAYLQRRCPACFGGKDKVASSPDLPMYVASFYYFYST